MKNCKLCSEEFEPHHHNDKYCSSECRKKSWRISKKNYKKTEKGKKSLLKWCRSEKFLAGQRRLQKKPRARMLKRLAVKRFRKTEFGKQYHSLMETERKILKRYPGAGRLDWRAWLEKLERLGNKCLCCGSDKPGIDHIIPLSKGGTNHIDNLQPLCRSCNRKKWNRVIRYG